MRDMKATLQIYGRPEHFSGSFEDDGRHAGYKFNAQAVLAAMQFHATRLATTGRES